MKKLFRLTLFTFLILLLGIVTLGFFVNDAAHNRQSAVRTAEAPQNGRYVGGGDCEIFVQEAGPRGGPVILFVGGTGAWSESWKAELKIAGDAGFHAVAIDLPPFGYSLKPTNDDYTRVAQRDRIEAVLENLGTRTAVIVGHSFGGAPVLSVAEHAPGRVTALLLVDPALGWNTKENPVPPAPSALVKAVLGSPPVRTTLAGIATHPALQKMLLQRVLYRKDMATDEKVAVYAKQMNLQGKSEEMSKWLADFLTVPDPGIVGDPSFLPAVKAPTTVLWGDHDDITPPWQGEKLAAGIPGAKLVMLTGVGHVPQIEDPAQFQAAFRAFLASLPTAPAAPAAPSPVPPGPAASPPAPAPAPRP